MNISGDFPTKTRRSRHPLAEQIELLRKSPLVNPVWYRQTYSDLSKAPIDVARHYLEHGAAEGRNPGPFFDTIAYLEQNPDVRASGLNPLVHYILYGEREGRPLPPQQKNEPHLQTGRSEAPRSSVAPRSVAEPSIKPPPLPTKMRGASEISAKCKEIAIDIRKRRGDRKIQTHGEIALLNSKLTLALADGTLSLDLVASALGDVLTHNAITPAVLEDLSGIGLTPDRTVDENALLNHSTPILQRYALQRIEITKRFDLSAARAGSKTVGPTISILMPVYNNPINFLERAILSILFQTYANWELLIVDDGSTRSDVRQLIDYYITVDGRIRAERLDRNRGISAATNVALKMSKGPYFGLLDADDMLTYDALELVAQALSRDEEIDLVYSDECTMDPNDIVDSLFFKPDWSPFLLINSMYTGHLSVYKKSIVEKVGCFRSEFDISQDYDLALRVSEQMPKVFHIDVCLYGWRMAPGSSSIGGKPTARISNIAALQAASDRRGYNAGAIALPTANRLVRRLPAQAPLVSIVVPSAGKFDRVKATIDSITLLTTYRSYEIIFVTGSPAIDSFGSQFHSDRVKFIRYDKPFNFSDKNNVGAAHATGDYVIFYNDDVLVISPDWIEVLLEYMTLPGVGAVSPKLIYENGAIQYAGMVTGVRRLTGTAFHSFPADTTAYFNLAQCVRETSIICGACLMMPMRLFNELGGWDTQNTPSAHSDTDLSFRIRERGYCCVYTPHAELTHIGHVEIGADEAAVEKKKEFKKDKADIFLLKRWGKYCGRDPYFPPKLRDLVYIDSQEPFVLESARANKHSATGTGKDFILFSHDLSASGAPRVLHDIAVALIWAGHYVLVMSAEDGPYQRRFLEIGADVIIDPLALSSHPSVADLARNFDVAICNTIVCWSVLRELNSYLPTYLYCHEGEQVGYFAEKSPEFRSVLAGATAIWAAGPVAQMAIKNFCDLDAINVETSVEELKAAPAGEAEYSDATLIAMAATYEPRKGQDLAIAAFIQLPQELQEGARLIMAGRTNDHHFRREIQIRADGNANIVFLEELDHMGIITHIASAEIVLVPSRDDTGPTTAMDALSAGKILVISAKTGVSRYIVDGESGFILKDNNPEDICQTLCRVFEQRSRWRDIGAKGREVYDANFTPTKFHERLFHALDLSHFK
jgi:O-antigen biosynthesis protein